MATLLVPKNAVQLYFHGGVTKYVPTNLLWLTHLLNKTGTGLITATFMLKNESFFFLCEFPRCPFPRNTNVVHGGGVCCLGNT